jgi:hypothetical protein
MEMEVRRGTPDIFGLYELSGDGTVLYSRGRGERDPSEPSEPVVGRDFFHEIAPFENVADLKRHFRRFVTDNRPSDTFVFDCMFDTEVVRAKVFMTRGYEVDSDHTGGIVIMDIRQLGE